MRWIILLAVAVLTSGCCFGTALRCNEFASATLVEPRMIFPYYNPVDVSTTTIDFY